jgi:hypothetical protein
LNALERAANDRLRLLHVVLAAFVLALEPRLLLVDRSYAFDFLHPQVMILLADSHDVVGGKTTGLMKILWVNTPTAASRPRVWLPLDGMPLTAPAVHAIDEHACRVSPRRRPLRAAGDTAGDTAENLHRLIVFHDGNPALVDFSEPTAKIVSSLFRAAGDPSTEIARPPFHLVKRLIDVLRNLDSLGFGFWRGDPRQHHCDKQPKTCAESHGNPFGKTGLYDLRA